MKKFIVWLFEKYCLDYWIEKQMQESKDKVMKENDLQSEEELEEYYRDLHNVPLSEAYYAGKEDGYNKAMQENFSL